MFYDNYIIYLDRLRINIKYYIVFYLFNKLYLLFMNANIGHNILYMFY